MSFDEYDWNKRCLGCGSIVADVLWRLGAILCHDCRDRRRSPDPVLLQEWADTQRVAAAHRAREMVARRAPD